MAATVQGFTDRRKETHGQNIIAVIDQVGVGVGVDGVGDGAWGWGWVSAHGPSG